LSDVEPIPLRPRPTSHWGSGVGTAARTQSVVHFDRREFDLLLRVYGRMVAAGEWRDYAIDFMRDRVVFCAFRRSSEFPIYRIIKDMKLARKQGAFLVVTPSGMILKRGHDLERVLRIFDKSLNIVAPA
jgi:hypothetical protein